LSYSWFFVWLLLHAGHQVSEAYESFETCEAARLTVEVSHTSPSGQPVEKTYDCRMGGWE
jgi:hypothetical protein